MKEKISETTDDALKIITEFFLDSSDYNGMPLEEAAQHIDTDRNQAFNIIRSLIKDGLIMIQSSTNPHIVGLRHYPIEAQLKLIDEKYNSPEESEIKDCGGIKISFSNDEYPVCLYPSPAVLDSELSTRNINLPKYSLELAHAQPQLSYRFFETDVLEKYSTDPRFDFNFHDFYGDISVHYDENGNPILRAEDRVFLKSFGLGFNSSGDRFIAVSLRDLGKLNAQNQMHWSTKEVDFESCNVFGEYFENQINGNWFASKSVFSALITEINLIHQITEKIYTKPLFRKSFTGENWPQNFTFFFSPTRSNYFEFINLLDKYLSENIDKKFFEGQLDLHSFEKLEEGVVERRHKGTLQLLSEWLAKNIQWQDEKAVSEIMRPLKKVRKERQKPAHSIIRNDFDKSYIDKQRVIMRDCNNSLFNLRMLFSNHPNAGDVEIPDWLAEKRVFVF